MSIQLRHLIIGGRFELVESQGGRRSETQCGLGLSQTRVGAVCEMMIRGPTIDGICRDMIKFGNSLFFYDTCQRQPLGAGVSIVEPRRPVPSRNPDAVLPSLSARRWG